jgi:hypothetical protein
MKRLIFLIPTLFLLGCNEQKDEISRNGRKYFSKLRAFIFLTSLILVACSPKQSPQEGITTIDLAGNLSREKDFLLSTIATDIEYVKLDNSIDAIIQQIEQFDVTDHYILIFDRTLGKVLLFDRQGKFLRQISRSGKGPGEFVRPVDVSINPDEGFIYITQQKQIDSYRITGEFVKSTHLPSWAMNVEPFGIDFLAYFPSQYSAMIQNYTIVFIRQDGTMGERLHKRNWDFLKPQDPMKFPRLYRYDDLWCYNEAYYDTVYAVTPDRKIVPRIAFIKDQSDPDPMTSSGFYLDGWRELPGYIFVYGSKNQKMTNLFYDRQTKEIWNLPYDTETDQFGITNDLDGGSKFLPGKVFKGKVFNLEYAFKFKDGFSRIAGKPYKALLSERRKQLEELVAGITDDDNQILTIVTLKK